MATRSIITLKTKDNVFKTVYCHWDGYPEGVGQTLLDHYNEYSKIEELINNGDMSSLREEIKPSLKTHHVITDWKTGKKTFTLNEHSFETPHEQVTIFYGRDRGDENIKARVNKKYPKDIDMWQEFEYLYRDGKWFFKEVDHKRFRNLEKALK